MNAPASLYLPDQPILVGGQAGATWLDSTGEIKTLSPGEVKRRVSAGTKPILCHLPATAKRLGIDPFPAFDLLELFAFVRPTAFCAPTPRGVARALQIPTGGEPAMLLHQSVIHLLSALADGDLARDDIPVAWAMARGGWAWGPSVLAALGEELADNVRSPAAGLDVWRRLPEWQDRAPKGEPNGISVKPADARARLAELLGPNAESRPSQADYASSATMAFTNRAAENAPNFVLAEAGTGVGKTLGYIAPASLWAEENDAPVWISTYTRNLQHQVEQETDRLYPDRRIKRQRVIVRKGRENYLCLLNMEEAVRGVAVQGQNAVALGLMARWAARSGSGDVTGGNFPAWLSDIAGRERTIGLADRRGECIYAGCAHYSKCFIERNIRRARQAHLVIANHALVMIHAARSFGENQERPTRYIFDEGHHVFDAADSAFSAHLTGIEGAELRRWIRGNENRRSGRSRGLKERVSEILGESPGAAEALAACISGARVLPGTGWRQRISDGEPQGLAEKLLFELRAFVYARAATPNDFYGLEALPLELPETLVSAARDLRAGLEALAAPLRALRTALLNRLDEEAKDLDTATRNRIESVANALNYRGENLVDAWRQMLADLAAARPDEFVDWFSVERMEGRDVDIGMHRHWIDPTRPFAEVVAGPAHGVLVTSATLTDGAGDVEADWTRAEQRSGAVHLPTPAIRAAVPSPFDYAGQTRVLIVNDVNQREISQVAAAYRELFLAAGGGALGLFTAITRLRAVHRAVAPELEQAGLPLYAQHVDGLNLSSLIDIFRDEENSCLLGTDAVRDGIDVPGRSLRLIVFDRVPWPRPTILHKARRDAFGGRTYDDSITRLRLKQAFGRLVRSANDKGVFVLLDSRMPSRLLGAFPDGTPVARIGLKEAIQISSDFLPSR